jgi:hypothetical protein
MHLKNIFYDAFVLFIIQYQMHQAMTSLIAEEAEIYFRGESQTCA